MTDEHPAIPAAPEPYGGSYTLPGLNLTRRYMEGRDLPPSWTSAIIELLRVCFNGGPNWFRLGVPPEEHLEWKFRDYPGGTEVIVSFDEEDTLVGFVGGMHRHWLVRGERLTARDGVDLCRHPDWQGRGVMRALRPFSEREWHPRVDFNFAWATHPADRKMSLETGSFAPANPAHDHVRLLRLTPGYESAASRGGPSQTGAVIYARTANRWTRAVRLAGLGARALLAMARRRPARPVEGVDIASARRFDARVTDLIAEANSGFDFIQERDEAFLNWRYADRRAGPFVIRFATRGQELLGYAVTRTVEGEAHLADILVRPDHEAVAGTLIRDSIQLASAAGATILRCRLPRRHPYAPELRRAGFIDLGATAGELMSYRNTDPSTFAFLASPRTRIHLVYGDSDTI